jgi:hypothetical protein
MALRGGAAPKLSEAREGHWTEAATNRFFEALGASCNVSYAARAAGLSTSAAYRKRRRIAAFRARWASALHEGYVRLELALLERALIGMGEPPEGDDAGAAAHLQALPPAVLLSMLKMHRDVAREGAPETARTADEEASELRERIAAKLKRLKARIEGA